jgi:hypothetical protein
MQPFVLMQGIASGELGNDALKILSAPEEPHSRDDRKATHEEKTVVIGGNIAHPDDLFLLKSVNFHPTRTNLYIHAASPVIIGQHHPTNRP